MKLKSLHLLEGLCHDCKQRLTADDVQLTKPGQPELCRPCSARAKKKRDRERQEEANQRERAETSEMNLFFTSQQMPDRGHDAERGTPGWIMGEPSPGRSF